MGKKTLLIAMMAFVIFTSCKTVQQLTERQSGLSEQVEDWTTYIFKDTLQITEINGGGRPIGVFSVNGEEFFAVHKEIGFGIIRPYIEILRHFSCGWICIVGSRFFDNRIRNWDNLRISLSVDEESKRVVFEDEKGELLVELPFQVLFDYYKEPTYRLVGK